MASPASVALPVALLSAAIRAADSASALSFVVMPPAGTALRSVTIVRSLVVPKSASGPMVCFVVATEGAHAGHKVAGPTVALAVGAAAVPWAFWRLLSAVAGGVFGVCCGRCSRDAKPARRERAGVAGPLPLVAVGVAAEVLLLLAALLLLPLALPAGDAAGAVLPCNSWRACCCNSTDCWRSFQRLYWDGSCGAGCRRNLPTGAEGWVRPTGTDTDRGWTFQQLQRRQQGVLRQVSMLRAENAPTFSYHKQPDQQQQAAERHCCPHPANCSCCSGCTASSQLSYVRRRRNLTNGSANRLLQVGMTSAHNPWRRSDDG